MRLGTAWVLLALLSAWPVVARGELKLVAVVDGRDLEVVEVRADGMLLRDGATELLAPKDVRWRVDGALESAPELVSWISRYSVARTEEAARAVDPTEATATEVVYYGRTPGPFVRVRSLPLRVHLRSWPKSSSGRRAVVAVWHGPGVSGHEVLVVPVTDEMSQRGYLRQRIEADAQDGRPALLVWQDGAFVPLAKSFRDDWKQRARQAAARDDVVELRRGLAMAWGPSYRFFPYQLLVVAAEAGAMQAMEELLKEGLESPAVGATAMHAAAAAGRLEAVVRLLEAKYRGWGRDERGRTALLRAVEAGHADVVLLLSRSKAVTRIADKEGRTPLSVAIESGFADIAQILWEAGAELDTRRVRTGHVLTTHAWAGNTRMVAWLLERGGSASAEFDGVAALQGATSADHEEIVRLLIEKGGVDVNHAPQGTDAPIVVAARRGHDDVVALLAEAGARLDATGVSGATALHFAAYREAGAMAELLLARGANPAAETEHGTNVLESALLFGAGEVARLVAAHGGRVRVRGEHVAEYVDSALALDLDGVLAAMLEDGLAPDFEVAGQWTLAQAAVLTQAEGCLRMLRERGAFADEQPRSEVVDASRLDARLSVVASVAPEDPREGLGEYPGDEVQVEVVVDANGVPRFPRVVVARDRRLAASALRAVAGWRFEPPLLAGQSVATRARVSVVFPNRAGR
ncbi:hypothetical protein ASA1KI_14230 [Opitutales bacterium ASA1]|uniref:ankyrin repeat domain-containing protein n=1 Tax=Congregicoccus parvus TaxID=3081749 RepID=UPI002B2D6436|nr:hypothetical protein ASA1KI_14230 [Opitutales bacterium ASA1]